MKINSISINDWMAFKGDHELDPVPSGAIAVVARYADNPRRSNWGGKTAFLEAIEWCLFGTHRKRYEDDLIHYGQPNVSVTIELSDGTVINRSRKRKKSTQIEVLQGQDSWKKKVAQDKIVEILGFDSNDYRATVCFAQGETAAMVSQSSAERRKIVAQWLELDAWLRVAARARAYAREITSELKDRRVAIRVHREELTGFDLEGCQRDIDGSEAERVEAKELLDKANSALDQISESEILRLDKERLQLINNERRDLRDRIKGSKMDPSNLVTLRTNDTLARSAEEEKRQLLRDAQQVSGGDFDGICPVTCGKCPAPETVRGATSALEAKAKLAADSYQEARVEAREAHESFRIANDEDKAKARLRDAYNARTVEAKRLVESINGRGDIPTFSDQEVEAAKLKKIKAYQAQVAAAADLKSARDELERMQSAQKWIAEMADGIEALEAKSRIANLAVRATGAGGVPAAIAEMSLGVLEERANAILDGTGLSFEFGWDRETKMLVKSCHSCGYAFKGVKDKECPACSEHRILKRADELEILVDDGTATPEDVKAKSGGAKVLVGSAIRLAAGMMLRERRGAPCAWASIDEPFGALDAENRENLALSFAGMLGSVGLEQAFVISHDGSLLDALPERVEIVRYETYSTLEIL